MSLSADLKRFYANLDRLADGVGGARRLGDCNGRQDWPNQGVYIVLDLAEPRPSGIPGEGRVVYTGTHVGKKSPLWGRLYQHRGTQAGGGQHRSSIFRNLVGEALIRRSNGAFKIPSWGQETNKRPTVEKEHEKRVSKYMENLLVLWLDVPDAPNKGKFLKSNAVALLSVKSSAARPDAANSQWLGQYSNKKPVQTSGLWNIHGVGETPNKKFLDTFEHYVKTTIHKPKVTRTSWSRRDGILTFGLYLRTEPKERYANNPKVIRFEKNMKQSAASIALKLQNFTALDSNLDLKGMVNYTKQDENIMDEYSKNPKSILDEITKFETTSTRDDSFNNDERKEPSHTEDSYTLAKTRPEQRYFRQTILAFYNSTCAITGINDPGLLEASHIIPRSKDKNKRADPRNGICLNSLHHKAFDSGFLSFDDDYCVILSGKFPARKHEIFSKYVGKKIILPNGFLPSLEFIAYHRKNIFKP